MSFNNSTIIIISVIVVVFFLIYNQYNSSNHKHDESCTKCDYYKKKIQKLARLPNPKTDTTVNNVVIDSTAPIDTFSDPIKQNDLYAIHDPLEYPQMRLDRNVLEKYNEYYKTHGAYPPFGQHASSAIFDNPILNGVLIKKIDKHDPFAEAIPSTVPLFRVKSSKHNNRYFYYILDQRYLSKIELKVPLNDVIINGVRYTNGDFYGLPEIYDGDTVENIPVYPGCEFKVLLYKTYHFP